jgi:hypothetical protein
MSNFKIFDGTNWIDPCDCNISIVDIDGVTYQLLNPNNCIVSYFDGTNWCPITCPCQCPEGYIFNPATNACEQTTIEPATPSGGATVPIVAGGASPAYGSASTRLYEDISTKIFPLNGWSDSSLCPFGTPNCTAGYQVYESAGIGTILNIDGLSVLGNNVFTNSPPSVTGGRLNNVGIWATGYPLNQWLPVEFCINLPASKTYIFAIAGDNQIRASITSTTFMGGVTNFNLVNLWASYNPSGTPTDVAVSRTFSIWHMFPITLPVGSHILQLQGMDFGPVAAFGAEIYDIPVGNPGDVWPADQTMQAFLASTTVTLADLAPFLAFTTEQLIQTPPLLVADFGETITWTCPDGSPVDFCNGAPQCIVTDSIPCGQGNALTSETEINIWFDNSGSMNTTLSPLQLMQSTILQACLLPIYNNDPVLYNERVKVLNMFSGNGWNFNERFIRCLAEERNFQRAVDITVNQVINLTFADESNEYGYGGSAPFNSGSRTAGYDTDIAYLRNVMSTVGYTIKGTAFRVDTGPGTYSGFRGLTQATFINNGAYTVPNNVSDYYTINFNCNLDTLAAASATYYRDQIVAALTALGISIPVCP